MTISAGDDGPRLTVHTNVIKTSSSPYLKAALSRDWKEALEKNIVLHETSTPILAGYIHWLYTKCIVEHSTSGCYLELFEFYILGDYLRDTAFCQSVIDLIVERNGHQFPPLQPEVCFVWERTLPDCPLRHVIKEVWFSMPVGWSIEMFREDADMPWPMDFILDVCQQLSNRSREVKEHSFSGKSFPEVKAACQGLFKCYTGGENVRRPAE